MRYPVRESNVRCLECGDKIVYGRSDRKFCCIECKNKYHNKMSRMRIRTRTRVLSALEKNYEILDNLEKNDVRTIDLAEVMALGFKAEYNTGCHRSRPGYVLFCFDIQYRCSDNRLYAIGRIGLTASEKNK